MLTYLLGPLLSFLPRRWRQALPFCAGVNWPAAATASGFLQLGTSIVALAYWYWYSMTTWISRALDAALAGKIVVTDHDIGISGLILWATHPLTWALGYCALEGAVRLCAAAFSDTVLGTLPLFLLHKTLAMLSDNPVPKPQATGAPSVSLVGAIQERIWAGVLPAVPDKLSIQRTAEEEEILEILASRRKADWIPPRVVRYESTYYRLEKCSKGSPPRPFRYVLRRLPAGVPGRTVLIYSPE